MLARRDHWQEASEAYLRALAAAEFALHSRLESADRLAEIKQIGNLARWTSFALARIGEPERAIEVLENGRTRELRRRFGGGDEAQVDQLPEGLRGAYLEVLSELSLASLGPDSDAAGRRLQELLSTIRQLPDFQDFAKTASLAELAGAVEDDWPLVYVNPSPYGTVFLSLRRHADGQLSSAAVFVDSPNSHDIIMGLMFGGSRFPTEPASYLAGPPGPGDDPERFRRGLDYVLDLLGEGLAKPLAEHLHDLAADQVTLVLCGPLAQAPLNVAPFRGPSGATCLLDAFDVRLASSAIVQRVCLARAQQWQSAEPMLVAVGNPEPNDPDNALPAAEAEVAELAQYFSADQTRVAVGARADRAFLEAEAPAADFLHLACHGQGGFVSPDELELSLSDGPISGLELSGMELKARLSVISACETAVTEMGTAPDEAFSLATAFLAAGSAGAVATLFSIDDAATALLMTRFYESLLTGGSPARALRESQLWLRDLQETEGGSFSISIRRWPPSFVAAKPLAGARAGDADL